MTLKPERKSLRKKSDLTKAQVWMAKKVKGREAVLLACRMGSGKTGAVLTALRRLLDEFAVRKVLVVAPKFVAEYTWPEEIAAWEHTVSLSYTVLCGRACNTPKKREAAALQDTEIHIINRENLVWLRRFWGTKKWPYDMLVYDESSRLKGGKKRTAGKKKLSEFGALASVRHKFYKVVELTGTPAPNGLKDLWGQSYILDLGERLGESKDAFLKRWFDTDVYGYNEEPKKFAHKQIMSRLSDVMFSLPDECYAELPPIIYNTIRVHLEPKILKEYKRFERSLVSEVYDLEAVSQGVLTNKLLQFANGSCYRADESVYPPKKEIVRIHEEKLAGLESVIEEAAGEQVLVAYNFKFDLPTILKKYPKATVVGKHPDWKARWDSGRAGILLAHPQSMGHGLNLQFGGHIACWYGLTWSLETYQQFNTRLPRPGQGSQNVHLHHIITAGTADEDVLVAMQNKGAVQDDITNSVVARITDRS